MQQTDLCQCYIISGIIGFIIIDVLTGKQHFDVGIVSLDSVSDFI